MNIRSCAAERHYILLIAILLLGINFPRTCHIPGTPYGFLSRCLGVTRYACLVIAKHYFRKLVLSPGERVHHTIHLCLGH